MQVASTLPPAIPAEKEPPAHIVRWPPQELGLSALAEVQKEKPVSVKEFRQASQVEKAALVEMAWHSATLVALRCPAAAQTEPEPMFWTQP